MATQWKRVYVSGKGYRWTDGKGNYKTSNPSYRNPANAAVNAGASAASSVTRSAASTATRSAQKTSEAAARTAERERSNSGNTIGYRARKDGEKPAAKPQPKPENRGNTNTDPAYARTRQAQLDAERERLKGVGNPTAKPAAKPNPPKPSGSGSNAPKPTPKPAGKVPSSNAGMKNQDKNFRGNPDRKDSIASTLRELRGMGSGRKTNEANASKPEDKSRYVASNGKPYAGPAFGDSKSSTAKKEDKKMTLAERMRKRRQGLA